jgi:hypothetical protein
VGGVDYRFSLYDVDEVEELVFSFLWSLCVCVIQVINCEGFFNFKCVVVDVVALSPLLLVVVVAKCARNCIRRSAPCLYSRYVGT